MAIIPVVSSQFTTLAYIPAEPKIFSTVGVNIDQLAIDITDENGFILDLNGFGVTIQLAIYHEAEKIQRHAS